MTDEINETNEETNGVDHAIAEEGAALDAVGDRLAELEGELATARDRQLRLAAEFDNYRKRVAREQTETLARAQISIALRTTRTARPRKRCCRVSSWSSANTAACWKPRVSNASIRRASVLIPRGWKR
jgi:septal ring factor EnvC (AmiA/AmiB activator)